MNDWQDGALRVLLGDCRERLRGLPHASVDALVTDPPAGISFMGRDWDTFPTRHRPEGHAFADGRARPGIAAGQEHNPRTRDVFEAFMAEVMRECLRVAKPGALGLVWAIPRTAHWTADALEEAGWEIHPNGFIAHHFASGFPKHRTHLKPATEVWWLVRKPGPGGLNIEACRNGVGAGGDREGEASADRRYRDESGDFAMLPGPRGGDARGRWPANLVLSHAEGCRPVGTRKVATGTAVRHKGVSNEVAYGGNIGRLSAGTPDMTYADPDGTETVEAWECTEGCPVAELNRQSAMPTSGANPTRRRAPKFQGTYQPYIGGDELSARDADSGGASRFFYVAKPSARERSGGLPAGHRNQHPTVKSIRLMRWLCRLVTPPGGVILDPFMGSGSTGCAAVLEGFGFVGIEQDEESVQTAVARLRHWSRQPDLKPVGVGPSRGITRSRLEQPVVEVLPLFEESA